MSPCGAAPIRGMPDVRLWLVRHPRPLGGVGLCYGRLDLPVDEAEVAQVAAALASSLPAGLVLRSSPARRCRLLADALLARRPDLRSGGPVPGRGSTVSSCLAALAEMDFGAWEGRPWTEVPEAELSAWTDDFADHAPGGTGECVRDFLLRVRGMLAAVPMTDDQAWCLRPAGDERVCPPPPVGSGESTQQPSGDAEVWITHAGVIRAVAWLLGEGRGGRMPQAAQWPLFKVDYGQVWQVLPAGPD